ncbi:hypothetical protein [Aestuariivirga sp.]|uniref:hypothetical protein n=1 Tax=Aestuariivirga sp. TaxID=2650926 RepID=UPI0039E62693
MSATQDKRITRLESHSRWGGPKELTEATVIVMRVPDGGDSDPRVVAARTAAHRKGQGFTASSSPHAADLPLWRPVPLDAVSDEFLDERISQLQASIRESMRAEAERDGLTRAELLARYAAEGLTESDLADVPA